MAVTKDITCHQAVTLVSDYLDGALRRCDRRRLERHLAGCDACSAYLEQMKVTIALTGSVQPDDLSMEALSHFVEIFEKYQRERSGD